MKQPRLDEWQSLCLKSFEGVGLVVAASSRLLSVFPRRGLLECSRFGISLLARIELQQRRVTGLWIGHYLKKKLDLKMVCLLHLEHASS